MIRKKLNVVVIDDDKFILEYFGELLNGSMDFHLIGLYSDGKKIYDILGNNKVDVVIIDIEMPGVNGLEIGEFINEKYPDIKIIFMTGHSKYALEGYKYYPFDFLVKPINPLRVNKTLKKIIEQNANDKEQNYQRTRIGIKVKKGLVLVDIDEISFIEKVGKKVQLYLKNKKSVEVSENLKLLEEKLNPYGFFRPFKSYLIPLNNIQSVFLDDFTDSYNIVLKDSDSEIKVSRKKIKKLKEHLIKNGNVEIIIE